ncbi:helix-turn-helix domain-containing protein [Kitasatospora sp. NRRL B-11411]|uniref:telomere-associated protein Tap n=1 Tax=Kitasatospora sp. NRRL B-11411 TaxID=1463822 RepID=UPI0004C40CDF|nr:helix-turn-helix domain-containing protein [Kitasatospora sp. NRRL B-11411]
MTGTPDAIGALLGSGPRRVVPLPEPAERERLRVAYGLGKAETAQALGISASTLTAWEQGRRDPQGEGRAAYARLLEGIAAQLVAEEEESEEEGERAGEAEEPGGGAVAEGGVPQAVMLDQHPDGSLVMAAAAPCVQCGQPSVYRAQGRPMHLGGFCRPPAPAPGALPEPLAVPRTAVAAPVAAPEPEPEPEPEPKSVPVRARARGAEVRGGKGRRAVEAEDWEQAAAARFPAGPLAVVDVAVDGRGLVAYGADGAEAPGERPAGRGVAELLEWALRARLGSARLHRYGKDGDPLLVLTDAAATELGLPPAGRDEKTQYVARIGRLPDTHKQVKALAKDGWQLTRRGLGPWARIYREPEAGRRQCVQLCVLPWGALDGAGWKLPDGLAAPELARLLGTYARRVHTPRGSTAVSGLELVTALRPPTRPVRTGSGWTSGPVEGSRHRVFDAAPPEVPDEHPLAAEREDDAVLVTEAWDWHRPLTDREAAAPFAVGLDVNMAFLAAAGRLNVPLSEPVHELNPAFDKKTPGSWRADLSGLALDPLLPNPFTADGSAPTGPAWYSTAKLAYAVELGADVRPSEGWLRHESGPYLDPWHKRLRQAYLDTMAALGVPADLADRDPAAFLDAMAALGDGDPAELAVLGAIKQTAKGTIGKFRERPRGLGYRPGQRWSALDRPTWDPLVRALVIDTATVNLHRKLARLHAELGTPPLAVLSDCAVFAAPGPSALDVLRRPDGGVSTALRLGVSPGHVKFEGSRPIAEIRELLADGANPARHIKTGGLVSADE